MIKTLSGRMRKLNLKQDPKINSIKYKKNGRREVDFLDLNNSITELNELVSTTKTTTMRTLEKS